MRPVWTLYIQTNKQRGQAAARIVTWEMKRRSDPRSPSDIEGTTTDMNMRSDPRSPSDNYWYEHAQWPQVTERHRGDNYWYEHAQWPQVIERHRGDNYWYEHHLLSLVDVFANVGHSCSTAQTLSQRPSGNINEIQTLLWWKYKHSIKCQCFISKLLTQW